MLHGIFVRYTLGGSKTSAPTTEVLGIVEGHPHSRLSCRELVRGKADDLEYQDGFFLDEKSQKICFVVKYIKAGTEDGVLEEVEISLLDGKVSNKPIFDTNGTPDFIRDIEQILGKLTSFETIKGNSTHLRVGNSDRGFREVARFLATDPCLTLTLLCNYTKNFYLRLDNTDTGTTQLKWLNPDTYEFEETNFKDEFCSLVVLSEGNYKIFIVDPQDPKNILGQLFWKQGVIRPQWKCAETDALFARAEIAIRSKLKAEGSLFSDVEFDYKNLQVSLIERVCTIYGAFQAVGFDGAAADFSYDANGMLGLKVIDTSPAESVMFYSHELVKMKSKIAEDEDTEINYSLFRLESDDVAAAAAGDSSKKTLVYIPGGPLSAFNTNDFLSQYKPFIADGYSIIVPHEPTRGGFGYGYFFTKTQLGKRNLHHIMNALNDACTKGVNPRMVLMGESYGGWVASALAAKWKEFQTPGSPVTLHACIAQAADLNWKEWKDTIYKSGHRQYLTTFADDSVDVASIAKLQAPLLICHGLGDVRCPIESIQAWAAELRMARQPLAFMTAPEGHAGILASSSMCSAEECEIRLNIVRRFFEGASIPPVSTEKLGGYGIEILHDSLNLFNHL